MLEAEAMFVETTALSVETKIYTGDAGALPETIVDASREHIVGETYKMLQTHKHSLPVEGIDRPSLGLDQDAAVDVDSMKSGEKASSSYVNMKEDVPTKKCCPRELIGKLKAVLSPLEEDMLPRKLQESQPQQELQQREFYVVSNVSRSIQTSSNSGIAEENGVLQKLLRRWRYFDNRYGRSYLEDPAVNSSTRKFGKPCYVCGQFQHNGKKCPKRRICASCKRRGHIAVDCPMSNEEYVRCLKCGGSGHELFSCNSEYSTDDLKSVQCYVCNELGHMSCHKYTDISPSAASCYNCGESGHSGLQCPKPCLDKCGSHPPSICYKCGEGDHVARKCPKDVGLSAGHNLQQASELDLGAATAVKRRTVRRSKIYRHSRVKKQKMKEIRDTTV